MRRSIATPCPVAPSQSRIVDETYNDDTTTNIEYTTAFHASFRNVRPKRGQSARRGTVDFAIHEDEGPAGPPSVRNIGGQPQPPKLLRPAKRVVAQMKPQGEPEKSRVSVPMTRSPVHVHNSTARRLPVAPKRVPIRNPIVPDIQPEELVNLKAQSQVAAERPARRKTLYIPSDDTTQPTMWMGIFSPIKHQIVQSKEGHGQPPVEYEGIAAQMAEKRMRRTSANQTKAKRLPLQHNSTAQAQASEGPDRAGAPTGKENLPPGHQQRTKRLSGATVIEHEEKQKTDRDLQRKNFIAQARIDKISRSRTQSGPNSPEVSTMYEISLDSQKADMPKPKRVAWNAGPRVVMKDERTVEKQRNVEGISSDNHASPQHVPVMVPTRFVQPLLQDVPQCPLRAPIFEHIEHPEMYEEDWLGQQEIAITQLLNSILSQARDKGVRTTPHDELRSTLLNRYNHQDIRVVYNRVQAACLYGSLSLTHEAMFQIQSLVNDIGRRKAFLKFWVDNYDSELLKTALEVVSGRQINVPVARKSTGLSPAKTAKRQGLANFIESFILRHEDSQFKAAGSGTATDLGSRTILKSLMLLKALDVLKEGNDQIAGRCLFRKNATIKSSTTAVQTLIQMLNPAVGDSIRALRQIGYTVSHQQEPFDELTCQVENIAVDLRDGVCLTRLVEVLLYRSKPPHGHNTSRLERDTITVSEEQVIIISRQEDQPLSRHLKLPCNSRAAKIWNVQIALGALRHVKNLESLIEDVRPDDIVDGYREKTMKVLWTIVGRWGLAGLIDKDDLRQEIKKFGCHKASEEDFEEDHVTNSQIESETLIKRWVEAVANSRGLQVRNFTTSFSDGRVFEAILDEYEPYLAKNCEVRTTPLHERLVRLGCSQQFSSLFTSKDGQVHIFGKDFVLAALAFLCSRVVGPSKLCRSVVRIQRCWRKHWNRIQQVRRGVKRGLAEACAASVCLKSSHVTDDKILTFADLSDARTEESAKTEIDEDIWLSL